MNGYTNITHAAFDPAGTPADLTGAEVSTPIEHRPAFADLARLPYKTGAVRATAIFEAGATGGCSVEFRQGSEVLATLSFASGGGLRQSKKIAMATNKIDGGTGINMVVVPDGGATGNVTVYGVMEMAHPLVVAGSC